MPSVRKTPRRAASASQKPVSSTGRVNKAKKGGTTPGLTNLSPTVFYKAAVVGSPAAGDGFDLSFTPNWKAGNADMFALPQTPSPFKNRRMTRRSSMFVKPKQQTTPQFKRPRLPMVPNSAGKGGPLSPAMTRARRRASVYVAQKSKSPVAADLPAETGSGKKETVKSSRLPVKKVASAPTTRVRTPKSPKATQKASPEISLKQPSVAKKQVKQSPVRKPPAKKSPSPRKQSPRKPSVARSAHKEKEATPKSVSPKARKGATPKSRKVTPKARTPKARKVTPKVRKVTPKVTPKPKNVTPKATSQARNITPKAKNVTPKARNVTPKGTTPRPKRMVAKAPTPRSAAAKTGTPRPSRASVKLPNPKNTTPVTSTISLQTSLSNTPEISQSSTNKKAKTPKLPTVSKATPVRKEKGKVLTPRPGTPVANQTLEKRQKRQALESMVDSPVKKSAKKSQSDTVLAKPPAPPMIRVQPATPKREATPIVPKATKQPRPTKSASTPKLTFTDSPKPTDKVATPKVAKPARKTPSRSVKKVSNKSEKKKTPEKAAKILGKKPSKISIVEKQVKSKDLLTSTPVESNKKRTADMPPPVSEIRQSKRLRVTEVSDVTLDIVEPSQDLTEGVKSIVGEESLEKDNADSAWNGWGYCTIL